MIKELSSKRLAFLIAVCVSLVVSFLTCGALWFLKPLAGWKIILLLFAASLVLSYFLTLALITIYIDQKIKLIYKVIYKGKKTDKEPTDSSSNVLGIVKKDVVKWAKENRQEIKELKEKAQFRREFIGNLAHELKTPLFTIQGYLFTLLEGGLEDKKINRDYLERADKNLDRLIDLVKDLDEITRYESGEMNLKKEKFNLHELIKEVLKLMELKAKEKNIKLGFNKKYDKPFMVYADYGKIHQVVQNLIVNAIHYGKTDGQTLVKIFETGDNYLIEIEDNGIGISEQHLPRLFERFYRVDKSRNRNSGGTGLGLAIVKHILEAHKGTINVTSVEGKGSVFSFTLPKINTKQL